MGIKQALVYRVAKRWIAGKDVFEALAFASVANSRGMRAILNYLGEDVADPSVAEKHAEEYSRLQRLISEREVNACVSLKLTQIGVDIDEKNATEKTLALAKEGQRRNQDVWIDMESSRNTDKTLSIYSAVYESCPNVGVALQAYMKRSQADLAKLLSLGGRVRLVKGAYRESSGLVFKSRREINENYSKLLRMLFEGGNGFAVATHDSKLIDEAKRLADSHHVAFEFEMLKGLRDELKAELVSSGYKVSDYVPYGEEWYSYSIRRVREHPSNIWLLLRSLL